MHKRFIAVIDSGIGGLSVLGELQKVLPDERFLYFGDNENAPYGNKTERELLEITLTNISCIMPMGIKAIVFGCNTLSTTIMNKVAYYFPSTPIFGVFPPVEINVIKNRKTLLLCTENTAKLYQPSANLTVLPLKNLAYEIEKNKFDLNNVEVISHIREAICSKNFFCSFNKLTTNGAPLTTEKLKIIFDHQIPYFDAVILGCTHYFFVKNKIFNHFRPQMLLRGELFTVKKVFRFFKNQKKLEKTYQKSVYFFGKNASENLKVFLSFSEFNTKNLIIL